MSENTDDMWGAALSEQGQAGTPAPAQTGARSQDSEKLAMIEDIMVDLSVEIGRAHLPIGQILKLAQGSIVELDVLAGEPLNVYVNGTLVAQGEVVVVNDKFGIRLTDVITPSERLKRMNKNG